MRLCSLESCGRKHFCKGYCQKHYNQIQRHGEIRERTITDPNEIIVNGDICIMKLYNNKCIEVAEAIFDLKYKELIEVFDLKWCLSNGYVMSIWCDQDGRSWTIFLHQLIIHLSGQIVEKNQEIDHKDGKRLNNLEDNLRVCDRSQNQHNRRQQKNNTSGQKCITWNKNRKKWQVRITKDYEPIDLGCFDTKEDAAKAYNAAAIKYFGEFAVLNIIPGENYV